MAGIHNEVLYGSNVDFTGQSVPSAQVTTDGQLLFGATSAPNIRVGDWLQPAAGIVYTYSQPTGTTARMTTSLANDLAAVEGLTGTGLATRTATDTWTVRSIAVTASTGLSITNGDGVSGNPTLAGLDATSSIKGVASWDAADFTLTSGNAALSDRDRLRPGVSENLGIAYASGTGTFTIQAADGNALSSTNPGYVALPSKANPGRLIKFKITANQTFIDDNGSSTIIGNLFGMTTGVIVSVDVPFYIYAVMNDSENAISFMISRVPHAVSSPASAKIGKTGSAVASTQGSFFALDNPTVTDYDANPCICIGGMRMRMSTSNDWTVQALGNQDGIGQFLEGQRFNVPRGHFGAATSKYFANNGGTAPDDADGGYDYNMLKSGRVLSQIAFPSLDTAGAGAVNARLATPFTILNGGNNGNGFLTGSGVNTLPFVTDQNPGASLTLTHRIYQVPGTTPLSYAGFTIGAAYSAMFEYMADLV